MCFYYVTQLAGYIMVALDSMIYLNFAALYKIWRPPRNNLSFNLHNMLFYTFFWKRRTVRPTWHPSSYYHYKHHYWDWCTDVISHMSAPGVLREHQLCWIMQEILVKTPQNSTNIIIRIPPMHSCLPCETKHCKSVQPLRLFTMCLA